MKQKLLTDIELDVHELKYLMDSFTKEPTPTLSELLKRHNEYPCNNSHSIRHGLYKLIMRTCLIIKTVNSLNTVHRFF